MTPRKETPIATRQAVINMRENRMRGTEIAMRFMPNLSRSSTISARMPEYRNEGFDGDSNTNRFNSARSDSHNSLSSSVCYSPNPYNVRRSSSRSHMIIEVPATQLKKINRAPGTVSIKRETQHFCETTTMHGPKRIYAGKRWAMLFWAIMVSGSFGLLITQVVILTSQYLDKPVNSQVTFKISEDGIKFPSVTFCNLNPIRRSYVEAMNETGDVPYEMIEYLMYFNTEIQALYGGSDRSRLHLGDNKLQDYQKLHPDFTPSQFFMDSGFNCTDVFKLCSFQGEIFNCCKIATPILTPVGKCFTLDMSRSDRISMHKQTESGISAGLTVTLDAHIEEQLGFDSDQPHLFTNAFVDGYRYYVHPNGTLPHLSSEEFTVTPNSVAYSAVTKDQYQLLLKKDWGSCDNEFPKDIPSNLTYTSSNCISLCKAKHFNATCGCAPSIYNLEKRYKECTPFETYMCVDTKLRVLIDDKWDLKLPSCDECNVACESQFYRAYNSYGNRFSNGGLTWLQKWNSSWTVGRMRNNFQMVNVFFRDMSYTEYNQEKGTTITELLSDIGGNMGMFLGVSVITITEIILYFSKILWIFISSSRRGYLYKKKINEKTHAKDIDATVEKMKVIESSPNLRDLVQNRLSSSMDDCSVQSRQQSRSSENVQFHININDLARRINDDSGYLHANISRSGGSQRY